MERILVTGITGQLGHDVSLELLAEGKVVISPTREQLDITDRRQVFEYLNSKMPEAIMHCAAWTAVDLAEVEVGDCRKVNVDGTRNIADWCSEKKVPIMYISTDYVFSGKGNKPWKVEDVPCPINVYGRSKLDGEIEVSKCEKHFIVRISWVFGINGKNFIKTMIRLSNERDEVKVVNDQIGSPTYTKDLAKLLVMMIQSDKYGVYHACNSGECSWFDLTVELFKILGTNTRCVPITSSEYPTKAQRPLNSRLDTTSVVDAGFIRLPDWKDALKRFIMELELEKRD